MPDSSKNKKLPTIYDIAEEAGVSYSTVSRTLSGFEFVKDSTREKVLAAVKKLGYVPNQQARSLAGGVSNLIGILVPGLTDDYVIQILHGIDSAVTESNYNVILYTTNRRQGKEATYAATIINGAADGLLLVAPIKVELYLDALREQNFPYVMIDQVDLEQRSTVVSADNHKGAYKATQYLIELGHRQIGFLTGLMQLNVAIERLEGYKAALADHKIPFRDEYIAQGDFRMQIGYQGTQELLALEHPPTAIFASNDVSALGAIDAIREHGLRVPDDISVIGFDDIPAAAVMYPKLTTVRQPLIQMGREAVLELLARLKNPDHEVRQITLATQLVIRDSCAAPCK
ncbi:MAG: LacI family DNA-binding transcriptional regulator [Anaerolineae bacterium]|nr:LacI family DNA-binding transcriptional regulator [Anaerolineae bacterium]